MYIYKGLIQTNGYFLKRCDVYKDEGMYIWTPKTGQLDKTLVSC